MILQHPNLLLCKLDSVATFPFGFIHRDVRGIDQFFGGINGWIGNACNADAYGNLSVDARKCIF